MSTTSSGDRPVLGALEQPCEEAPTKLFGAITQAPQPYALFMRDPRSQAGGGSDAGVGLIAFSYAGGADEPWDELCCSGFLSNEFDLGDKGIKVEAPAYPGQSTTFRNVEAAFLGLQCWQRASELSYLKGAVAREVVRQAGVVDSRFSGCGNGWAAMLLLLEKKFAPGSKMAELLLQTDDAMLLFHTRSKGEKDWSDGGTGGGINGLGVLLMLIRDQLGGQDHWTTYLDGLFLLDLGHGRTAAHTASWKAVVTEACQVVVSQFPQQHASQEKSPAKAKAESRGGTQSQKAKAESKKDKKKPGDQKKLEDKKKLEVDVPQEWEDDWFSEDGDGHLLNEQAVLRRDAPAPARSTSRQHAYDRARWPEKEKLENAMKNLPVEEVHAPMSLMTPPRTPSRTPPKSPVSSKAVSPEVPPQMFLASAALVGAHHPQPEVKGGSRKAAPPPLNLDDSPTEVEFVIRKRPGARLGISFEVADTGMLIETVDGGLIGEYNQFQKLRKNKVEVGDFIFEINGIQGTGQVLTEEAKTSQVLRMKMLKDQSRG